MIPENSFSWLALDQAWAAIEAEVFPRINRAYALIMEPEPVFIAGLNPDLTSDDYHGSIPLRHLMIPLTRSESCGAPTLCAAARALILTRAYRCPIVALAQQEPHLFSGVDPFAPINLGECATALRGKFTVVVMGAGDRTGFEVATLLAATWQAVYESM
jgi:hypothetical protein